MENLSNRNLRLLDKLVGQSIKSEPTQELNRIMKLYFDELIHINDKFLYSNFKKIVENKIYFVIKQDFRFYDLEKYIKKYPERLDDYLRDIPDSIEDDFIEFCISEQNSILDNTVKYLLEIENNDPINVLKFVSENFLDEYKSTSKRKIEFLNERKVLFSTGETIDFIVEYENPYPDYFKSYGYELFNIFLKEDLNNNNKILAKASFLVDKLRKDRLMNSELSLKKIFDFIVEKFDLNLGKSTKFKSEYSRDKYLPLYNLIKSNFLKD